MKVTIGKKGLKMSWQTPFPATTECCRCGGKARIGFVAHEGMEETEDCRGHYVCNMYDNKGGDGGRFWLHDYCAVAVYFCSKCLETTALYNQA
jgi:hypothetical protein